MEKDGEQLMLKNDDRKILDCGDGHISVKTVKQTAFLEGEMDVLCIVAQESC